MGYLSSLGLSSFTCERSVSIQGLRCYLVLGLGPRMFLVLSGVFHRLSLCPTNNTGLEGLTHQLFPSSIRPSLPWGQGQIFPYHLGTHHRCLLRNGMSHECQHHLKGHPLQADGKSRMQKGGFHLLRICITHISCGWGFPWPSLNPQQS